MRRTRSVALALAAVLASAAPALAQEAIKIGVVGPLTGAFAAGGQSQLSGAEIRAKEINTGGGKYKIELMSEDDASNCNQSANATVKLITQGRVAAILGAVNSPCSLAMVPLTHATGCRNSPSGLGRPSLTRLGMGVQGRGRCERPDEGSRRYAMKELKHQKIAVLYSDDEYGASMANGFKEALAQTKSPARCI